MADWCKDRGIMFKLNSVGQHNWEEGMNYGIDEIAPFRWKVRHLRGIPHSITKCSQTRSKPSIDGKNVGPKAIHDARELVITKAIPSFLKTPRGASLPRARRQRRDGELILPSRRVHEVRNVAFLLYSYSHYFCSGSSTAKAGKRCLEKAS